MTYYNENDPNAAQWLRALIAQGGIPDGEVDERSISDVQPIDLIRFSHCHFFAGIGGWALALRLANWPDNRPVWTGSCPCQPFSSAGKGKGTEDERHLWPDFYRLIRECRPATVFGEQVASPLGREWLNGVFVDLESGGYAVAGADLCAAGVGAPHTRQRLYWVADSQNDGWGRPATTAKPSGRQFAEPSCRTCGVGNATGNDEWRARQLATGNGFEQCEAGRHGASGGLGDTQNGQRGPVPECGPVGENMGVGSIETSQPQRHGPVSDAWDDYELIDCADGKTRRIKPGVAPLVDGFPNRMAVLKGLGNAIVPPLAAQFIEAYLEIEL